MNICSLFIHNVLQGLNKLHSYVNGQNCSYNLFGKVCSFDMKHSILHLMFNYVMFNKVQQSTLHVHVLVHAKICTQFIAKYIHIIHKCTIIYFHNECRMRFKLFTLILSLMITNYMYIIYQYLLPKEQIKINYYIIFLFKIQFSIIYRKKRTLNISFTHKKEL